MLPWLIGKHPLSLPSLSLKRWNGDFGEWGGRDSGFTFFAAAQAARKKAASDLLLQSLYHNDKMNGSKAKCSLQIIFSKRAKSICITRKGRRTGRRWC
jgi:hypothetical protein